MRGQFQAADKLLIEGAGTDDIKAVTFSSSFLNLFNLLSIWFISSNVANLKLVFPFFLLIF